MPDDFHAAFAAMLRGGDDALLPWVAAADLPRLTVYRNTVFKALGEAVMSAFPSVAKCLPPQGFAGLALGFARAHAPSSPVLADYGEGFAEWLAATEAGREAPHLGRLARLDRLWTEAHLAADSDAVTAAAVAAFTPEDYGRWAPGLIASARIAAFDDGVPSLWTQLRQDAVPEALTLDAAPEAILIWRPDEAVMWRVIDAATFGFLSALAAGATVAEAAGAAIKADPSADMAAMFATVLGLRVIAAKQD